MDFFPSLRSERLGDRVSATGKNTIFPYIGRYMPIGMFPVSWNDLTEGTLKRQYAYSKS